MKKVSLLVISILCIALSLFFVSCGDEEENKCDHSDTEIIKGTIPNCTQAGMSDGEKCKLCQEMIVEQRILNKTEHSYQDSYTCTICNATLNESQGLEYEAVELANGDKGYAVVGIGTCTDKDIIIPYTYNSLPVFGIGYEAFKNCEDIASVTTSNGLRYIDDFAFAYCIGLTKITIGANVEPIWFTSFLGCNKLVEIYDLSKQPLTMEIIKASLRGFGGIFINQGGPEIKALHTSANEPSIISNEDDFLFMRDSDKRYLLGYVGDKTNITLPQEYQGGAYYLYKYAFSNTPNITNITVPNNLLGAMESCFQPSYWSKRELSLQFNEKDGRKYIGSQENPYYILAKTDNQATPYINGTKIIVSGNILDTEDSEITIPDSVIFLGRRTVFSEGKTIKIGNGLKDLELEAFVNTPICFVVDSSNSYFKAVDGSLYTKDGKTLLKYAGNNGEFTIANGTATIAPYAFSSKIKLLTIPQSVVSISNNSFEYAPENVNYLGTIKSWVTADFNSNRFVIDNLYFNGELLSTVVIDKSITEIRDYAFANCSSLKTLVIEDGLTKISDYAFYNCDNLHKIEISNSVTSIGDYAFSMCDSIYQITIPSGVSEIGTSTFYGLHGLIEIYNLSSVDYEFGSKVVVHKSIDEPSIIKEFDDFLFAPINGVTYAFKYTGDKDTVTLPRDYYGEEYTIRFLRDYFISDVNIKHIIIPDGAKLSQNSTFANSNIESITIGKGMEAIPSMFLQKCTSLKSVVLPEGLTTIGSNAFSGCTSLNSIVIPSTVTNIEYRAFEACYSLVEVYNLSELNIVAGKDHLSYVGYYAKVIHTSLDEKSIIKDAGDYKYVEVDGKIYLVSYTSNSKQVVLPRGINGKNYILIDCLLAYHDIESIIIPSSVEGMYIFSLGEHRFYFEGDIPPIYDNFLPFEELFADSIYLYSETKPTTEGNYWHYVNGEAVAWE